MVILFSMTNWILRRTAESINKGKLATEADRIWRVIKFEKEIGGEKKMIIFNSSIDYRIGTVTIINLTLGIGRTPNLWCLIKKRSSRSRRSKKRIIWMKWKILRMCSMANGIPILILKSQIYNQRDINKKNMQRIGVIWIHPFTSPKSQPINHKSSLILKSPAKPKQRSPKSAKSSTLKSTIYSNLKDKTKIILLFLVRLSIAWTNHKIMRRAMLPKGQKRRRKVNMGPNRLLNKL